MNHTRVISSNLYSVGYENNVLEISFNDGSLYRYSPVPMNVYAALMRAPSKGKYFHAYIKDRYQTIKMH